MPATTSKLREQYVHLYRRWAGEFVVIVLGILAAFAVDSWSEERSNQILEQQNSDRKLGISFVQLPVLSQFPRYDSRRG